MKTNDILSKLQSSNTKLETVLNKKKFSADVKNLLLSMLYKITSSYNDYANIKVNVENKNRYVEDLVKIIDMCTAIELVKPGTEEGEEFIKERNNMQSRYLCKDNKSFSHRKSHAICIV